MPERSPAGNAGDAEVVRLGGKRGAALGPGDIVAVGAARIGAGGESAVAYRRRGQRGKRHQQGKEQRPGAKWHKQ